MVAVHWVWFFTSKNYGSSHELRDNSYSPEVYHSPGRMMVGRWSLPFWKAYIFRGKLLKLQGGNIFLSTDFARGEWNVKFLDQRFHLLAKSHLGWKIPEWIDFCVHNMFPCNGSLNTAFMKNGKCFGSKKDSWNMFDGISCVFKNLSC